MRFGTRDRNIIKADSNEFGSNRPRSNPLDRIAFAIRVQSASRAGLGSLQTLSINGAEVNNPATHGRTRSVISASEKQLRIAFIAGIASTESPTQLGPRMRIFFT